MKKSRVFVLLVVLLALLLLLLSRCGSSSDGPTPSADLSLIGMSCDSPGETARVDGADFVCVSVTAAEGTEEAKAIYYGVAAETETVCDDPGAKRKTNRIVEVCSGGKDAKKRKWVLTTPVPLSVSAFIDAADSTDPGALEEAGVAIPEPIAALPGMQEFAVAESTTTQAPTSTVSASTEAPTLSDGGTTTSESATTTGETTTTTEEATTTLAPVTTLTATTTTGEATTSTIASTTTATEESTTTATAPTTTVGGATTTVAAAVLTCAEGGPCKNGDIGPGGGTVLVWENEAEATGGVFEIAPVTWYLRNNIPAAAYADRLVYGSKSDWRLPRLEELTAVVANRNIFTCPGAKRCAKGFANALYLFNEPFSDRSIVRGFHLENRLVESSVEVFGYVRPVRSISGAVG